MKTFRSWASRIRALIRRRQLDKRVQEELDFHIRMETGEFVRRGMAPPEARAAARRKVGNTARVYEEVYHMNTISFLDETVRNVRFSLRTFRRSPGFAVTAVLVLALGLGASTAMFSALDRILFRPLPYGDPDRLVHLGMTFPGLGGGSVGENRLIMFAGRYQNSWKPAPEPFTATTSMLGAGAMCDITEQPAERLLCARVESNFLETLGVRIALGRDFTPEDDVRGAPPAVIISHEFWTRRFGADPGAIDRTIDLDGGTVPVVGVLPAGFVMPVGEADILRTQQMFPLDNPLGGLLTVFGRLEPGVTAERAKSAITPIIAADAEGLPTVSDDDLQPGVEPLRAYMVGDAPSVAWLLLAAVGGLLLIACVNVANLILARLGARNREFAVRSALGAGRTRLARLALAESLVLAGAGGGLGLLVAAAMLDVFARLAPSSIPDIDQASLDMRVFAVAGLLALSAGAAVGIWPALSVLRTRALHYGTRATAPAHPRMRFILVTVQIALTVALLGGSALLLRTLRNQIAVPLGYQSEQVFTMTVTLNGARYPPGSRDPFFDQLFQRIREFPPTTAAAMTSNAFPGGFNAIFGGVAVDGQPSEPLAEGARVRGRWVSPGYFRTFRIPILQGRAFADSDLGLRRVVVLSESAANVLFPGQDAIGHTIQLPYYSADPMPSLEWAEIVGVAGDVRNSGPTQAPDPELYILWEDYGAYTTNAVFAMRTQAGAAEATALLTEAVADLDPLTPVTVEPLERNVARFTERPRFLAWLLAAFAGLALLLAAAGLYGVASYLVTQRTRDIGVRIAMGAAPGDIAWQVVGEAGRWIAIGALGGGLLAWTGTRAIESQLFGVTSFDPVSWIAAFAVLGVALLVAVLRPAVRAARVDPMKALRAD